MSNTTQKKPEEKKLSPAEVKAMECQRFFIFGRKKSCRHCLWRRLEMCSEAKGDV